MSGETNGEAFRHSNGFVFRMPPTLTGVQRLGVDTASQVIEGFIDLLAVDKATEVGHPPGPATGREPSFAQLRGNVARALDLYTELVRRSFESYADLMEQGLRVTGVRLQATDDGAAEVLTLQRTADGTRVSGTVWIHNTTDQAASADLRLTDLTAHDGTVVPSGAGRFEPTAVTAAPGASVSARLEIMLDGVAPGIYQGHVMACGLPEAALPVRLLLDAGPLA
jgi:hypothetical protein